MSSQNWSPIRRVAEMLNAGHRNILTFQWTPELAGGKAEAAIAEMVRHGLVIERGFAVEPTEAFANWFADFRQRKDQTSVQPPAEQPVVVQQEVVPQEPPVATSTVKRKRYFAHLSRDRYQSGMEMAARIKEVIEANVSSGGTMRLSALKRSLHADRHRDAWEEAIRRLVVHRVAKVAKGKITLTRSGNDLFPDPYGRPEPKRRRRNRGQSEWFEENRSKMDEGQHSDFHEDWSDEDDDSSEEE